METPCIKTCTMEPVSGLCMGCGRSLYEIAHWPRMADTQRARIMAELADRMTKAGIAPIKPG